MQARVITWWERISPDWRRGLIRIPVRWWRPHEGPPTSATGSERGHRSPARSGAAAELEHAIEEHSEAHLLARLEAREALLVEPLLDLMRFHAHAGSPRAALHFAARALRRITDPERRAQVLVAMGQFHEQSGEPEAANRLYREAMLLEPSSRLTWYAIHANLARCLNQMGRHAEAERHCLVAIGTDPGRSGAYCHLGVSMERQGRLASAVRFYVQAVNARPADPEALGRLESLVAAHPEIAVEVPDIREILRESLQRVRLARAD